MVSIVKDSVSSKRRDSASKVLEILSGLLSQELSTILQRLESLKQRATDAYYQAEATRREPDITKLKTSIAGLNSRKQALCDFLIYRSENSGLLEKPWTWTPGEEIPQVPKDASQASPNSLPSFSVPPAYLCSISQEVMDDPVITCDEFTFERNAIER